MSSNSFEGENGMENTQPISEEVDFETIATGMLNQSPSKRPCLVFDQTACSSSLGAGKENRDGHNVPSYQEDFDTVQGPGETKKPVLSDLSDSIRTTYG